MNSADVKRLALILAVQAEIEGMKSANIERESNGVAIAWDESMFCEKAEELRNLAHAHEDQL